MTSEVPFSSVHIHAQSVSCVWLCNRMDCTLPGSSDFSGKHLVWVSISFRGSSPSRDQTHVSCISCIGRWILYHCCHLLAMTSCNYVLWASFAFSWEVIFPLRNCLKSFGSDESLGASHFLPFKAGRTENKKAWSPGQANYNLFPLLHKGVTQPEMAWIPVWDFKELGWEREFLTYGASKLRQNKSRNVYGYIAYIRKAGRPCLEMVKI